MNIIEKILDQKTQENSEGRRYYKQWEIAKDYMPQLLQLVGHVFPHYSLHDESHSETILNNITKILGKDVLNNFSIVDLWLLLTAAYYHDCGMVVSGDDINECLKEGSGFIDYVKRNQVRKDSSMHPYAELFDVENGKLQYKQNEVNAKNVNAFKFLLADYTRSNHANRSKSSIQTSRSLHLPGNLIPDRIIKILGKICFAHTAKREDVMSLPQVESSGCGIEDCHPRYIAFLLRIGDLLDVDTNRVSSVLLSSVPSIPDDSELYNQTNRDITHIRIDRSVIEMTAHCDDYQVAMLITDWFKMINDEITFLSKFWYKLVPSIEYGNLPSVGDMVVELEGYENISSTDNFKFQIDSSKAIEMLQGAELYRDAPQSVREILQNAVDATYLRIYLDHPEINQMDVFYEECKKRPIKVTLKKVNVEKDFSTWNVTIKDQGIGLERSELTFLSCPGSSSKNQKKYEIINNMPSWMRPSGTFGIGFQSIFLIADNKVTVKTQKYGKEETLILELYNPAGKENGAILVKRLKDSLINCGTEISFDVKLSKDFDYSVNCRDKFAIKEICSYDFVKSDSFDYLAGKICDEIYNFSKMSHIPIQFVYKEEEQTLVSKCNFKNCFYDPETGLSVSLQCMSDNVKMGLYYRNQYVENFDLELPFLNFCINILDGDAKNILTLNRNDVQSSAEYKLRQNIIKSTCRLLI